MGYIVLFVYRLLRNVAGSHSGTVRRVAARKETAPPAPRRRPWRRELMVLGAQAALFTGLKKVADRRSGLARRTVGAIAFETPSSPPSSSPSSARSPSRSNSEQASRSSSSSSPSSSPSSPSAAQSSGAGGGSGSPDVQKGSDILPPNSMTIGSRALCLDGNCGELSRIILDPISRRITHVVVSDLGADAPGWLVPARIAVSSGDHVQLACSQQELRDLELAEPTHVAAVGDNAHPGDDDSPTMLYEESHDVLAIRPRDQVRAIDGVAGVAYGVVTDPRDPAQMTHLLVEVGENGRRVAVPMSWISSMKTGVQLNMSSPQLAGLPAYGDDGSKT